jgi:uncharacterized protein (DUF2252 family)
MKAERAKPRAVPTPAERQAAGEAQRKACERDWLTRAPKPDDDSRDPLGWLRASNQGRVPELVPLRHGRMLEDPLAFYRGAASLMAHDLAGLPHSGVMTQLCGDAHLANFGFFASPERSLLFDITDFDETLPGPFDWDLRRLATSFVIAGRELGFKASVGRDAVAELTEAYRDHMRRFARMDTLEAWYWRLTSQTLLKLGSEDKAELAVIRKARRSTARVFAEEATKKGEGGRTMIRNKPPYVYHDAKATQREIRRFRDGLPAFLAQYRTSLAPERRVLLDRYTPHDVAVLTPGVGSVGRRCFLLLLVSDQRHPLFLQCKEASASVLETHLGPSAADHAGQRIVDGQRLMQAAGDIFLGWAGAPGGATYYVRQLRDMKASYKLEQFQPADLREFAQACGYGLARAHAKGGDAWTISGYLGRSRKFHSALMEFSEAYADVNRADWKRLRKAVADRRLKAIKEPDEDA